MPYTASVVAYTYTARPPMQNNEFTARIFIVRIFEHTHTHTHTYTHAPTHALIFIDLCIDVTLCCRHINYFATPQDSCKVKLKYFLI